MRFVDQAIISITAGHGGPGAVSFRREKFVPKGGPDGGNGGRGGSIIFQSSAQKSTLQDFRFKRIYKAENGSAGAGANKTGEDGEDLIIEVPAGTVLFDEKTGLPILDMTDQNQVFRCCKGGRGGKGNAHFTSSTFQAPRFAQSGEPGEAMSVRLELKLLADVGLIGFPNAGKSTLISLLSAAKPKIANYPFTTLTPNLGVCVLDEEQSCVIADIPGLIRGAHKGHGLGHQFLRHVERTKVLVHLLDGEKVYHSYAQGRLREGVEKVIDEYLALRIELKKYNKVLAEKPEIVLFNKCDLFDEDALELIKKEFDRSPEFAVKPSFISAASATGTGELKNKLLHTLNEKSIDDPVIPGLATPASAPSEIVEAVEDTRS